MQWNQKLNLAINRLIRRPTFALRLMPSFLIIGVPKAGTTSLYNYLIRHPLVRPSLKKEVNFFSHRFYKGINWYRIHFPLNSKYLSYLPGVKQGEYITGEASTTYIGYPHAARRIKKYLPQVKLIALLRNPIDRAYSHYNHRVQRESEKRSFEEAITQEPQILRGEFEKILENENYSSMKYRKNCYLSGGIYLEQLKTWFDVFPKNQILILKSEDLFMNPHQVYQTVLNFLELPSWQLRECEPKNQAISPYGKMNADTRQQLREYFSPHNQLLYEYLGVNFNWD
jgi:hypothetical protein